MEGRISFSLLTPVLSARFSAVFAVASRKSVLAWRETALPDAHVVVLEASSDRLSLQPVPPCVIWVGNGPSALDPSCAWEGCLAQNFTVADFVDVLDRAAVALLDWSARQMVSAVSPKADAPVPGAATAITRDADLGHRKAGETELAQGVENAVSPAQGQLYSINAWVFLRPPFNSASYVSTLALLARQSVSAQQLLAHSGLPPTALIGLLQELERRKVLQIIDPVPSHSPACLNPSQGSLTMRKGIVRQLSRWLTSSKRMKSS